MKLGRCQSAVELTDGVEVDPSRDVARQALAGREALGSEDERRHRRRCRNVAEAAVVELSGRGEAEAADERDAAIGEPDAERVVVEELAVGVAREDAHEHVVGGAGAVVVAQRAVDVPRRDAIVLVHVVDGARKPLPQPRAAEAGQQVMLLVDLRADGREPRFGGDRAVGTEPLALDAAAVDEVRHRRGQPREALERRELGVGDRALL